QDMLCWGHALPCRPLRSCQCWTPSTAGVGGCGEGGPRSLLERCGHSAFLGYSLGAIRRDLAAIFFPKISVGAAVFGIKTRYVRAGVGGRPPARVRWRVPGPGRHVAGSSDAALQRAFMSISGLYPVKVLHTQEVMNTCPAMLAARACPPAWRYASASSSAFAS